MTACFGARHVKMIPKRAFSCYPNRPHLAASVYCHHRGGTVRKGGYRTETWQGLPQRILLDYLTRREKYQTMMGKMIPEGMNYSVCFFLCADMGSVLCIAKKRFSVIRWGFLMPTSRHCTTDCIPTTQLSDSFWRLGFHKRTARLFIFRIFSFRIQGQKRLQSSR